MTVRVRTVTITPEYAANLLQNNPKNRPLKGTRVAMLASDMRSDRWELTGNAIQVAEDGTLLDGQHRLRACLMAGVPFVSILATGLATSARAVIDTGAKRTHGDILRMRAIPNSTGVAAASRMLVAIAHGSTKIASTTKELDVVLDTHLGLSDSVHRFGRCFPTMGTVVSSIHYIGTYMGYLDQADAWATVFATGKPAYTGCPAHLMRERLIKTASTAERYSNEDKVRAACVTWKHFVKGQPLLKITINNGSTDINIPGWTVARLGLGSKGEADE